MIISQHSLRLEDNFNSNLNLSYQEDVATLAKYQTLLNYFLSSVLTSQSNIVINNIENVEKKLLKIIRDGKDKVHVISDFDMTITKYWHNGARSPSSHDILSKSSKVSQKYHDRCNELKNYYYPIEISPELTDAEKYPYMVEWWQNAHKAVIDEKIHESTIKHMVEETPVVFRPGIRNVLYTCKNKDIPFLVFSAGIQNVIYETMLQSGLMFNSNMNVVSNKMLFNPETGICDRFADNIIHIYNKNNFGLKGTPYEKLLENRENVIVCGDSLGDLKMSEGVPHTTCLSIGFLNLNKEKMLDKYKEMFDIVICDDGSFDILNELLNLLV